MSPRTWLYCKGWLLKSTLHCRFKRKPWIQLPPFCALLVAILVVDSRSPCDPLSRIPNTPWASVSNGSEHGAGLVSWTLASTPKAAVLLHVIGPYTVWLTGITRQMHILVDTIYLKVSINVASRNPAGLINKHRVLRNLLNRFINQQNPCLDHQDGPCVWAENASSSFHCDTSWRDVNKRLLTQIETQQ